MNIDAYNDQVRYDQQHQPEEYIPGYDPDNDPLYHVEGKANYSADLHLASQNYWAGKTGRDEIPMPSYQMVRGRPRLGRYVDVYSAQAFLRWAKHEWRSKLWLIIIAAGASVAFGVEFGILDLFFCPPIIIAIWLYYRHWYVKYYRIQRTILETGEPVWIPYERKRLKLIRQNQFYLWP